MFGVIVVHACRRLGLVGRSPLAMESGEMELGSKRSESSEIQQPQTQSVGLAEPPTALLTTISSTGPSRTRALHHAGGPASRDPQPSQDSLATRECTSLLPSSPLERRPGAEGALSSLPAATAMAPGRAAEIFQTTQTCPATREVAARSLPTTTGQDILG